MNIKRCLYQFTHSHRFTFIFQIYNRNGEYSNSPPEDLQKDGYSELPVGYTSGKSEAHNSICIITDNMKVASALRKALRCRFEELKESSLGVFIKFKGRDLSLKTSPSNRGTSRTETPKCGVTRIWFLYGDLWSSWKVGQLDRDNSSEEIAGIGRGRCMAAAYLSSSLDSLKGESFQPLPRSTRGK
ncbi:hypothetical protein Bca52824_060053 [Brassica carinata]|uniref:Uncharacterized protein n=1 Tax=Brassica carinata TaxID=52824 RepID=A0A8X7QXS4_BRACI|nr:hypothetical protein Bca52824_060053 [Brassica carinata]